MPSVIYERRGRVAYLSLNRPRYRNAFSREMTYCLDNCFRKACEDAEVRVIVLRANGEHFCSGHDLGTKEHLADLKARPYADRPAGDYKKWADLDRDMCLRWRSLPKPIICGVKGYVIYHGTALVSVCDLVIAADNTKLMPTLAEYTTLPFDAGLAVRRAKEIMMTQRFVLADEALQLGIYNRVVAPDALDSELTLLAEIIAKSDSFHLRQMKENCNAAQDMAGFSNYAITGLLNWTAFRWDWTARGAGPMTKDHGGTSTRLAPIPHAESEAVMRWSRSAVTMRAQRRQTQKAKL